MSKKKTLSCAAVFGMILAGGLLTVCSEKESFSELENRYLAKFPAVRASSYFSGDLCDGIEEYLSDHFFMREDMVKIGMGTADLRYRGEFRNWRAKFRVKYNANGQYDLENIINIINAGGVICGVGEWRPERDGQFGMYHVVTK